MMQEEGFFITKQTVDNTDTLSLRVNATASKNGTRIFCSSLFTHSDVATLIILTGIKTSACMLSIPKWFYTNIANW